MALETAAHTNGGRAPARLVGQGAIRVIVSHGWMGDHHLFDPFIEHIDTNRFSYAFLDCPGYGSRLQETGAMTMDAVAEDVLGTADHLGWPQFHIVGHSMGGMVAQRLIVDAPERLQSAVLIAPVPASGARIDDARRALLRRALLEIDGRRDLIDVNTGRRRDRQWLDRILQMSLGATRPDVMEAYMQSWISTDFSADVAGAHVRVLLILGDLDPGASLQGMSETILRWFPATSLHVMADVGHYPMQERPEELASVIARHLTRSAP